jgi:hypothetical protein
VSVRAAYSAASSSEPRLREAHTWAGPPESGQVDADAGLTSFPPRALAPLSNPLYHSASICWFREISWCGAGGAWLVPRHATLIW